MRTRVTFDAYLLDIARRRAWSKVPRAKLARSLAAIADLEAPACSACSMRIDEPLGRRARRKGDPTKQEPPSAEFEHARAPRVVHESGREQGGRAEAKRVPAIRAREDERRVAEEGAHGLLGAGPAAEHSRPAPRGRAYRKRERARGEDGACLLYPMDGSFAGLVEINGIHGLTGI
jgi:hypothetical protein